MGSRIEDYALIGDGRTAALVSCTGSIDWLCLPRFDSDACCAALLGTQQNGYWQIAPRGETSVTRSYCGDTLVLQTDFRCASGVACLTDFMPVDSEAPAIVRQVTGLRGSVPFRCEMALRFDYGLLPPRTRRDCDTLLLVAGPHLVALRGSVVPQPTDGVLVAEFVVTAGQSFTFVLSYGPSHCPPHGPIRSGALDRTLAFWGDWAGRFQREMPWRDAVVRSLLTLKALIYRPTGAMIAAPTTSLPEMPEGSLNWDYRYCWVRDATFMLSALLNAGYRDDAVRWRDWMLRALGGATEHMRILYRVDGDRRMYEQTVPWLRGFAGAAPVVAGNDAAAQEQIDVVREMLDALDLIERAGAPCSPETIAAESELMARLKHTWQDKDQGPWESRGPAQHYTYSIAMCSVGVDCFIRSASRRGHLSGAAVAGLCRLRDRIRSEAIERGWNHARGHFVHHYGGEQLDPSLLLLPLVGFLPANEPRMAATIDAIERDLSADGLVWRSPRTGEAQQGAFIACSCWLADCRALQGRRTEAVALLERVLTLRNDVGLLSEGYHPGLRRLMGNFPQALSHIAVINTALGLTGPVLQRGGC